MGFASKESECEVQYDEPLIQKTFMKLTDEKLMNHVSELASHQAERQNKLAGERRLAKVNVCEVDKTEIKQHRRVDDDNRILVEIREIRSELENLKRQQVGGNNEQSTTHYDRKQPKSTRYRGWGCKRVRSGELALVVSTASLAENLDISRPSVQKTQKFRETRSGYPAVGTGFIRRCNIPSV